MMLRVAPAAVRPEARREAGKAPREGAFFVSAQPHPCALQEARPRPPAAMEWCLAPPERGQEAFHPDRNVETSSGACGSALCRAAGEDQPKAGDDMTEKRRSGPECKYRPHFVEEARQRCADGALIQELAESW